jgi:hypothetical protein
MGLGTQELIERSLFEAIRKKIVALGYLPDISSYANTQQGYTDYRAAISTVQSVQGFAAEVFNHGSSQSKQLKRVPRIAIVTRRVFPGDIGGVVDSQYENDPLNPNNIMKVRPDNQTADLQIDIHLVSNTARQDRFLNEVLGAVIGRRRYVPLYTDPTQLFFVHQYNYYDLPDTMEGIMEKVLSYEVKDLYLFEGEVLNPNIPLIKEITLSTSLLELESIVNSQGIVIGPYITDSALHIDLSGIQF